MPFTSGLPPAESWPKPAFRKLRFCPTGGEPDAGYPATQMGSVTRRLDQASPPVEQEQSSAPQFNVLLVSPIPAFLVEGSGANIHGSHGQQATETIKVLESLNIQVELDYLRPPTWESLSQVLRDEDSPVQRPAGFTHAGFLFSGLRR